MRNYRDILKEKLENRMRVNPQYSLRTFAKFLEIAAPRLSCILNNKQGVSKKVAIQLADKLALSPEEKELFVTSAVAYDARSKKKRLLAQEKIEKLQLPSQFQGLDEEKFKIISDWYYFALLELTDTKTFNPDSTWIAKRLGLNKMQVDLAIERLQRLGLIEMKNGQMKQKSASLSTSTSIPSEYMKHFYQQVLDKAKTNVVLKTPETFDYSTLTIAIDKSKMKEFKDKIKRFRSEINEFAENIPKNKRDDVYMLNINFFNLTEEV